MITLLVGTDAFRLKAERQKLAAAAKAAGAAVYSIDAATLAEGESLSEKLAAVSASASLFGGERLIFIEEPLAAATELKAFLEARPGLAKASEVTLVFRMVRPAKEKKGEFNEEKKSFLEYLEGKATNVQRLDLMPPLKLAAWLKIYAAEQKIRADSAALSRLAQLSRGDTGQAAQMLASLAAYAGEAPVTAAAVAALIPEPAESRIFAFIDALANRDLRGALRALLREFAAGTNEFLLVSMIAYQIRTLLIVRDLLDRKAPASKLAVASGLKPFVLMKASRQVRRFTREELENLFEQLANLHLALRRSPLPAHTLLERFVFKFAGRSSGVA